jgi:hypothetical protein
MLRAELAAAQLEALDPAEVAARQLPSSVNDPAVDEVLETLMPDSLAADGSAAVAGRGRGRGRHPAPACAAVGTQVERATRQASKRAARALLVPDEPLLVSSDPESELQADPESELQALLRPSRSGLHLRGSTCRLVSLHMLLVGCCLALYWWQSCWALFSLGVFGTLLARESIALIRYRACGTACRTLCLANRTVKRRTHKTLQSQASARPSKVAQQGPKAPVFPICSCTTARTSPTLRLCQ